MMYLDVQHPGTNSPLSVLANSSLYALQDNTPPVKTATCIVSIYMYTLRLHVSLLVEYIYIYIP